MVKQRRCWENLEEKKMDLIKRIVASLLFCVALLPKDTAAQGQLSPKQAASLVHTCLSTGQCQIARVLYVHDEKPLFHEIGVRVSGLTFEYTAPVGERRLELHVTASDYQMTFIDTDADGIVDHMIHVILTDSTVLVYGKHSQASHANAQDLYLMGLDIAISSFKLMDQTAKKK